MYSKDKPGKANKGSVQVKSSNSRLQLVFSFGGKRHYLSTGYPDTPQYRKLAQMKATEIDKDILYERFEVVPLNYLDGRIRIAYQSNEATGSPGSKSSSGGKRVSICSRLSRNATGTL
jgi:hypothetical protein